MDQDSQMSLFYRWVCVDCVEMKDAEKIDYMCFISLLIMYWYLSCVNKCFKVVKLHFDGLMQERRSSIAM